MREMKVIVSEMLQTEFLKPLSISVSSVKRAIENPDSREELKLPGDTMVLFFFKRAPDTLGYMGLLAIARPIRLGLEVDAVYRIPKGLSQFEHTATPLDLLRALAQQFGFPIQIGEQMSSFVLTEKIPVPANGSVLMPTV